MMYISVSSKSVVSGGVKVFTYIDNFRFSTSSTSTGKSAITGRELSFNDGTANNSYTNSSWKKYEYGSSSFVTTTKDILKIETGEKVLSLYCGGNTYKLTYNESGSAFGEYNHFAIDIGADNGKTVSYRIELVTDTGRVLYPAGGETYMATITGKGNESLQTLSFNFSAAKIKSIVIYASTGDGHFLMDNITFSKLS